MNRQETIEVKRKFKNVRIIVSIVIFIAHLPLAAAALKIVPQNIDPILTGTSLVILTVISLVTATFMTIALWNFIRLFGQNTFRKDLNRFLVGV